MYLFHCATSDFKCENTPKVNCLDHQLEPTLESPRTTRDQNNNIVCVYDNCKNKCNDVNENCYTYHNGIVKAKLLTADAYNIYPIIVTVNP